MASRTLTTTLRRLRPIIPSAPLSHRLLSTPPNPLVRSHRETRQVPFTTAQLYEAISDVDDYHNFVPWCTRSKVIRRISETQLIADLSVGFHLLSDTYTSVVTLKPNQSVSADVPHSTLFQYLITDWSFESRQAGGSNLHFHLEFAFRNPIYQRVTNLFFEQVVTQMVTAFDNRCHQRFHTHSPPLIHRW